MCIKVIEKYSVCRCIYYSHAADPCPAYGRRGHAVKTMEVLVGLSCGRHPTSNSDPAFIGGDKISTVSSDDSQVRTGSTNSVESNDFQVRTAPTKREDVLKKTAVESTINSPLRAQLLKKAQRVLETDEQFIPGGDLEEALTTHAIEVEPRSHKLADISHDVFHYAKKIFAILLVIGKLDALQDFIDRGLRDEDLPLAISMTGSMDDEHLKSAFSGWDLDARKQFADFQWTLLALIFLEGKHLKLHDETRLPFIKTKPIAKGAFGGVHRVEIHSDHERLNKFGSTRINQAFALKQFTKDTEDFNSRAFHQELATMKAIRSSGHGHIVKFLATFEQRGRFSMILPLAEENLRQFWAHSKPSSVAQQTAMKEMVGLSMALSYLHNDLVDQDSGPMIGWHMDLKPENILVWNGSSASNFTWKISDFGVSRLKPKGSILELPPHPGLGTYEPPECQLNLPQSQACDIWSLGCILLECAVWLRVGSDAIEAFAEDRLNDMRDSANNFRDDYFFTLESDESCTPLRAVTRPAVIRWIRDLDRDKECSKAISGLLHLIKDYLLQVDQSKRLTAGHLSQNLEHLSLLQDTDLRISTLSAPVPSVEQNENTRQRPENDFSSTAKQRLPNK